MKRGYLSLGAQKFYTVKGTKKKFRQSLNDNYCNGEQDEIWVMKRCCCLFRACNICTIYIYTHTYKSSSWRPIHTCIIHKYPEINPNVPKILCIFTMTEQSPVGSAFLSIYSRHPTPGGADCFNKTANRK